MLNTILSLDPVHLIWAITGAFIVGFATYMFSLYVRVQDLKDENADLKDRIRDADIRKKDGALDDSQLDEILDSDINRKFD